MAHGIWPDFIWPIEFMGHMKNLAHLDILLRKSGRATGQAALPIPKPLYFVMNWSSCKL